MKAISLAYLFFQLCLLSNLICTAFLRPPAQQSRYSLLKETSSLLTSTVTDDDMFFDEIFTRGAAAASKKVREVEPTTSLSDVLGCLRKVLLSEDEIEVDFVRAADMQFRALTILIKSDEKNRDDDLTILYELPPEYTKVLQWINDLCWEFSRVGQSASGPSIYSLLKLLQKKEGLLALSKDLESDCELMKPARDIVEMKRKIERSFSEVLTVAITSCILSSHRKEGLLKDLQYFARVVIDKCNIHDRHYALLLLCRGLLAPVYKYPTRHQNHQQQEERSCRRPECDIHSIVIDSHSDILTAYKKGMAFLNVSQPSIHSRLVFPYLLLFLRCHKRASSNEIQPSLPVREVLQSALSSGLDESTVKACLFLKQCMAFDRDAEVFGGITEFADDLLLSLRRWLCDSSAAYLINLDETEVKDPDIDDGVLRNTIAMELLLTQRVFSKGRKKDREGFFLHCAAIGRVCDLVFSSMTINSAGTSMKSKYGKLNMVTGMKLGFSIYSSSKYLGEKSSVRYKIESLLGFQHVSLKEIPKQNLINVENFKSLDDFQFFSDELHGGRSKFVSDSNLQHKDDEELWGAASNTGTRFKIQRRGRAFTKSANPIASTTIVDSQELVHRFGELLCGSISEIFRLGSDERTELHKEGKFREQLLYIYSTWRRPHLLIDYFRMHYSSPDLQRVYKRYLKALFAISNETVDDIRSEDPRNRRHFSFISPKISRAWLQGKLVQVENTLGTSDSSGNEASVSLIDILKADSPISNASVISATPNGLDSFRIPKLFTNIPNNEKSQNQLQPIGYFNQFILSTISQLISIYHPKFSICRCIRVALLSWIRRPTNGM